MRGWRDCLPAHLLYLTGMGLTGEGRVVREGAREAQASGPHPDPG